MKNIISYLIVMLTACSSGYKDPGVLPETINTSNSASVPSPPEPETTKLFFNSTLNKINQSCRIVTVYKNTPFYDSVIKEWFDSCHLAKNGHLREEVASCSNEHIAGICSRSNKVQDIITFEDVMIVYSKRNDVLKLKERCINEWHGKWINGPEFPYEDVTASTFYNAFHSNILAAKKKFSKGFYISGSFDRIIQIHDTSVLQLKANSYNEILVGGLSEDFMATLKKGYQYKFLCNEGDLVGGIYVSALACKAYASREYSNNEYGLNVGTWKLYK